MVNHPPSPPSAVKINGVDETDDPNITNSTSGLVSYSAVIDDADAGQPVKLVVQYSSDKSFAHKWQVSSGFGAQGRRQTLTLNRLNKNTLYYVRSWTVDHSGAKSSSYNASQFWTDRYPLPPTLNAPAENALLPPGTPVGFDWTVNDPDNPTSQNNTGYQLRIRYPQTATTPPGPWTTYTSTYAVSGASSWTDPGGFAASHTYEWSVRTRNTSLQWGAWSDPRSFSTSGVTKNPTPLAPAGNTSVHIDDPVTLVWRFNDPQPGATQGNANVRYRAAGSPTWTTVFGSGLTDTQLVLPADLLSPGIRYEWQVMTTRATGADPDSDWSDSAFFWAMLTPGSLAADDTLLGDNVKGQLGCGIYTVDIYERGGTVYRGTIPAAQISNVFWGRRRDDISQAGFTVSGYTKLTAQLLSKVHTWHNEIVLWRNDERVWEGPVVWIEDTKGQWSCKASDVMVYPYRRIMRQGYNDSYKRSDSTGTLLTVVDRAEKIITNALAYAEPNVLPYLTCIRTGNDAQEARIVPDYTKSSWEDVDDMAANAGLDYTTVSRRIILWDTHTPIGQLPELRDDDFLADLIVTEYGMSLANYFGVTDGQGTWGAAYPTGRSIDDFDEFYGPVEQLANGYQVSDNTTDGDTPDVTTDPAALAALRDDLTSQARRNIANRWPAPRIVRVPDNTGLKPETNVRINQLVPGVWVPLRCENVVRPLAQMQKLDQLNVTADNQGGESVGVVLSPAPIGYDDPDANGSDTTEDTG